MLRNGSEFHNYPQPQPPTKTEKNMQKAGCDNADQQLIQCPGQWSALVELDLLQTCKLNVPKTQGNFFGEKKQQSSLKWIESLPFRQTLFSFKLSCPKLHESCQEPSSSSLEDSTQISPPWSLKLPAPCGPLTCKVPTFTHATQVLALVER